ncbi:MAG: hypothetical protein SFV15_25435 [Polyangiaceae bacterium]|nr:hypothetical protein [Polyangiaceae bacterium]
MIFQAKVCVPVYFDAGVLADERKIFAPCVPNLSGILPVCQSAMVWLVLGCPGFAHAQVKKPQVAVTVDCPILNQDAENRAALEARALVELTLRRVQGVLEISCDDARAYLKLTESPSRVRTSTLPVEPDAGLFVDHLLSAVWELSAPETETVAGRVTGKFLAFRVAESPRLRRRWNAAAGVSAEYWSTGRALLAGPRLALAWGTDQVQLAALAGVFTTVKTGAGVDAEGLLFGATVQYRGLHPLTLSTGAETLRISVSPPEAFSPARAQTWAVAGPVAIRGNFMLHGVRLELGPEVTFYPLTPAVQLDGSRRFGPDWMAIGLSLWMAHEL